MATHLCCSCSYFYFPLLSAARLILRAALNPVCCIHPCRALPTHCGLLPLSRAHAGRACTALHASTAMVIAHARACERGSACACCLRCLSLVFIVMMMHRLRLFCCACLHEQRCRSGALECASRQLHIRISTGICSSIGSNH